MVTLDDTEIDDISRFMILICPLITSCIGLGFMFWIAFYRVMRAPKGSERQVKLADAIKIGAKAFLKKEYTYLSGFVFIMLIVVGFVDNWHKTAPCFLIGALISASCGYGGMIIAVEGNVRTTEAAKKGLNEALAVAFGSGAVMGLSVVSLGLLGLIFIYTVWGGTDQDTTRYLAGFGFGASSIALFARVGGGIYTKAADVGADLVGKVEAGIPEDDPRNPATIADNVGDNVGDVAGMGADLFESFVGSIIATIQLSESAVYTWDKNADISGLGLGYTHARKRFIALPFWVAGFGVLSACAGIVLVRTKAKPEAHEMQGVLLGVIRRGIFIAAGAAWILSGVACGMMFGFDSSICWELFGCITIGLIAGEIIGFFTEYATSFEYKPTISIAKKTRMGSAGVVIQGLGIGMLSTTAPVIVIFIATIGTFELGGTYGIGIAAVGMLSTLGVTLATDAFGPVADNAGGIAEMAELPPEVRDTTDALDALGNTTAATGKGFAIGSAVLTALALLSAFKDEAGLTVIDVSNSEVLASCIMGACLPYIFAALTMMAVGRAASLMIEEVRRQFREFNLLDPACTRDPDYQECVAISTRASLIEMVIPSCLAILAPLFIGYLLGAMALGGMLIGGVTSGFMLAVFMANAGGAWDNAKKFIEAEGLGAGKGKGSSLHKAAVVGDTIGDPFKDTSGPSLNILIKLMTMMSLVFAQSFKIEAYHKKRWFIAVIVALIFFAIAGGLTYWQRKTGFGKIKYDSTAAPLAQHAEAASEQPINAAAAASDDEEAPVQSNIDAVEEVPPKTEEAAPETAEEPAADAGGDTTAAADGHAE